MGKHSYTRRGRGQAMRIMLHGPSLHEVVYQQAHGACFYCGKKVPRNQVTLDHKIPVKQGGQYVLANLVLSCLECNRTKDRLTVEEYRALCGGKLFPGEQGHA